MKKILFIIPLFISLSAAAQEELKLCDRSAPNGNVQVVRDKMLDTLIAPTADNFGEGGKELVMQGFRVQVFAGNERTEAQRVKSQLLELYPDEPIYLLYEPPYFKVRAGDFRNKIDAQKMLHELKQQYGSVLLVPDKINLPELNAIE